MIKLNGVTNEETVEAMLVAFRMKQATVNDTIVNTFRRLKGE